jgi:hypothetical protein
MLEKPEIRLLKGFGDFNFGETAELIRQVFGDPNEIQNLNDDILNTNSLVYHYWDKGCSLFFDSNKNQRFCSVETDNKDTLLFQIPIFSLQEKELVSLLKEHGYTLSDTEMQSWGEKRLSFDEAGLDCYFENKRLISVNFGLIETENDFDYFPN